MTIIKLGIIAVITVLIALKLKSYNPSFSSYLSLALCIFILFFVFDRLKIIVELIEKLSSNISIDKTYIEVLFKLIGVAYICEFSSSMCKDAGYSAIAGQIETAGKLSMLVISMPIVFAIIDTVNAFLY